MPARLQEVAAQLTAALPAQPPRDGSPPSAGAPAPPTPSPILTTKLYVPRRRDAHLERPHLLTRLAAGLRGPLTLIAAPAGYGKTTLLADLLASPRTSERVDMPTLAWLSLDAGDNDAAGFVRYLVAALQRALARPVGATALALLETPAPPALSAVLTALINDLAAAPRPVALVLDDYHAIGTPTIHDALSFLLEHRPPGLHLVIASRADPPLPLARLRARGQLTELRAADLRFAPGEVAAFLNDLMQLNLGADDVAALEARTEGWIAALQLAALAIRNHPQRDRFVGAFAGSNRFIVDYLASEVLDHMPAEARTFLLRTSILSRVGGPLCDAVLGGARGTRDNASPTFVPPPASSALEGLERANLFLIPLDDERRWYRYHQLFAEVLRERLARSLPAADIADLHRRASTWFEQHELVGEAIQHALAARDFARSADLIERVATSMALGGQHATLGSWLAELPADLFDARPHLALARAAVAALNSDDPAAEAYLRQADAAARGWDREQTIAVQREGAAHRAVLSSIHGDERAIALGRAALAELPVRHALRGTVVAGLGFAYFYAGRPAVAAQLLQEALAARHSHAGRIVAGSALAALLALVRRAQGRLREVLRLSGEVLERATPEDRTTPLVGALLASLLLGLAQCEQNKLDAAEQSLTQCARLADKYHATTYAILAQFYLGQVQCARGDVAGALTLVERAAAAGAPHLSPRNRCQIEGYRAMLWLKQGDLAAASGWAERHERAADLARPQFTAYDYDRFALARISMAQGRWDAAQAAAEQLLRDAAATDHGRFVIVALVLRALVLQARGDTARGEASLARALALAAPEGFVRVFVDEGAPMAALLARVARHRAPVAGYAATLLAAFPSAQRSATGLGPDTALVPTRHAGRFAPGALVEPLSERELEVLRLLAEGRDNAEIARTLVVAVSTIKSHINRIYGKLGVGNRLTAVLRAQQLNLL
jgi:LuxR family maltose regulon positive regulatory protein